MGFRDQGFSLFEGRDSRSYCKMGARLRIKSMHGMRDAENSHRDYEMEKNLGRDDWIKEPHHAKNSFLT